jgi:hypothetical protein
MCYKTVKNTRNLPYFAEKNAKWQYSVYFHHFRHWIVKKTVDPAFDILLKMPDVLKVAALLLNRENSVVPALKILLKMQAVSEVPLLFSTLTKFCKKH